MKQRERVRLTELMGTRVDARFCIDGNSGKVHIPWPKQQIFLSIDEPEAFYGGAAGGGKSDALLFAFLQFVDQPHYRGLILRRNKGDLMKSDAILTRALEWWQPSRRTGIRYNADQMRFTFPSGATCQFGHANTEQSVVKDYQGSAYHFIAFDELTQFSAQMYLYLFSRCRRTKEDEGRPLIPLRIRSAGNPGGKSHLFVRNRFMSLDYAKQFLERKEAPYYSQTYWWEDKETNQRFKRTRYFVPARASDNFALDAVEYRGNLQEMDVVTREQLMNGNWLISASGRFKPEWFKIRYKHPDYLPEQAGGYYIMIRQDGSVLDQIRPQDCHRYSTIDPAGTEAELTQESNGREPSHSVMSTWDHYDKKNWTILRSVKRMQGEFPEVMDMIRGEYAAQRPNTLYVERDGIGRPYYQQLTRERYPTGILSTNQKDKLTRAAPATNEAKEGRIIIPDYAPWLDDWEAEIFSWTGIKGEVWDQGDTMSYAIEVKLDGLAGNLVMQSQN